MSKMTPAEEHIQQYTRPQEPGILENYDIGALRELTRVMCIALGGDFHIVTDPEDMDHAFDVWLCEGAITDVEIWRGQRNCYGMINSSEPEVLHDEGDLARLLRRAKGLESGSVNPPTTPPVLTEYAGHRYLMPLPPYGQSRWAQ